MQKKYIFTIMLLSYIFLIIFFAVSKSVPTPPLKNQDKILHFLEFLILAALLYKTFSIYNIKYPKLTAVIIGILFAAVSEIIQIYIPGRSFSSLDFLADIMGITIALVIWK